MNIPEDAVAAAALAVAQVGLGKDHSPGVEEIDRIFARAALEAAAPHMMAGALQQAKRLTGPELAAEYHAQQMDAVRAFDRAYPYGESEELDAENARVDVIERFATLPHYDDEPTDAV